MCWVDRCFFVYMWLCTFSTYSFMSSTTMPIPLSVVSIIHSLSDLAVSGSTTPPLKVFGFGVQECFRTPPTSTLSSTAYFGYGSYVFPTGGLFDANAKFGRWSWMDSTCKGREVRCLRGFITHFISLVLYVFSFERSILVIFLFWQSLSKAFLCHIYTFRHLFSVILSWGSFKFSKHFWVSNIDQGADTFIHMKFIQVNQSIDGPIPPIISCLSGLIMLALLLDILLELLRFKLTG